ncbi:restriction endonuclease subunit S [Vibrio sp. PNB22_2_2]
MINIPKSWELCKLDELLEYVTSGSRDWSKYYSEKGANFIRTQDINKNKLSLDKVAKVALPEKVEGKRTLVHKGDILVTITGANVGKCAYVNEQIEESYVSQSVALVRPMDKRMSRFLQRQLISGSGDRTQLQKAAYGMGRPVLNLANIRELEVVIPPLPEQKRIVEKLDEVLAQVDTIKARLDGIPELLKRFRQSVLASAVSGKLTEEWRHKTEYYICIDDLLLAHRKRWEESKWDDFKAKNKLPKNDKWKEKYKLPESVVDGSVWTIPSNWCWASIDTIAFVTKLAGFEFTKFVKYVDEGTIPVIKAENVGKDGFKETDFSLVPMSIVEALPRSEVYGGELLVTFVGAGVGQVCRLPSDKKYFLGPNVALVRALDLNVDEQYLEYLLKSNGGFKNLLSQSKGAAQPSLSMTQIRQTSVPVPPLVEQKEIVRLVDQYFAFADTIEAQVKKAQARVDNLTQSILAKAFRGELVPQNDDDESAEVLLKRIAQARKEADALAKAAKKAGKKKS